MGVMRAEWTGLGGIGRASLLGLLVAAVLAIGLGFFIPRAARDHLVDARLGSATGVVGGLSADQLLALESNDSEALSRLDSVVRLRLLGGETVRVKLWAPDGTIVYSDVEPLIGQNFEMGDDVLGALEGVSTIGRADLAEPENRFEQGLGSLLEFYVPVMSESGDTVGVFEIYQRSESLDMAVDEIRRNVWLSIGIGLGVLSLFMTSLMVGTARVSSRRRQDAEELVDALIHAQDDERDRIVGALHDDVGQPLYRVLYGLQGSRALVAPDGPVGPELARLEDLVREVDDTLRSEMRMLRHPIIEDVGLREALSELVETTRAETDLRIELDANDAVGELSLVTESALYRTVAEAVTNIRRHAGASRVAITLRRHRGRVAVAVVDDGSGYRGGEGLGLTTTRQRLEALGGGLSVVGLGRTGTELSGWVPVAMGGGA